MLAIQVAVLLTAVATALVATPMARHLAIRLGLVEALDPRKIHRAPTPYLGGLAIYATLWVVVGGGLLGSVLIDLATRDAAWLPAAVHGLTRTPGEAEWRLLAIAVGATLVLGLGLLDDMRGLPVAARFSVQGLAAAAAVWAGVLPEAFADQHWLAAPLAVVWIVGMTNAFNFIDGMDGLCAGVGAIATGLLAVYLNAYGQPITALFLLALFGAQLGFLRWNFYPARIFLGNAGAMLIGYLLGVMTLEGAYLTLDADTVLPAILPLLVLGVPLYDALSVIAIRLWHRRSPFRADTNHLHHRLKRTGMTDKQTVLFLYLLTGALGINAVLLAKLDNAGGLVLLAQVCAVMGCVVILERIIRRATPPRGIAAVPGRYAVVAEGARPGAELRTTGRFRAIDAGGCVCEPGEHVGGEISDLLAERRLLEVELSPEDLPGYRGEAVVCAVCGEGIQFKREIQRDGRALCRACAGESYFKTVSPP